MQTDDFSPSQIGEPTTRMCAAWTRSYSSGHSSLAAPCSRMSGYTPTREVVVDGAELVDRDAVPPMIAAERSIRPCVFETLGRRLQRAVDEQRAQAGEVPLARLLQLGGDGVEAHRAPYPAGVMLRFMRKRLLGVVLRLQRREPRRSWRRSRP